MKGITVTIAKAPNNRIKSKFSYFVARYKKLTKILKLIEEKIKIRSIFFNFGFKFLFINSNEIRFLKTFS